MKLIYPAIFYPHDGGAGWTVEVPDLPGCVTEGDDAADALAMAQDAACGWVLDELEDGRPAPEASDIANVSSEEPSATIAMIMLDIDAYAERYGSQSVRKNLTIPAWLDTFASNQGINYSHVLRDALETLYRESASKQAA